MRSKSPLPQFTRETYASERAEWLIQAGVTGVEDLNGPHIKRLTSTKGIKEVEAALQEAGRIAEETGTMPVVDGLELAKLVRMARASEGARRNTELAETVASRRAELYERIARSAGVLAIDNL